MYLTKAQDTDEVSYKIPMYGLECQLQSLACVKEEKNMFIHVK